MEVGEEAEDVMSTQATRRVKEGIREGSVSGSLTNFSVGDEVVVGGGQRYQSNVVCWGQVELESDPHWTCHVPYWSKRTFIKHAVDWTRKPPLRAELIFRSKSFLHCKITGQLFSKVSGEVVGALV